MRPAILSFSPDSAAVLPERWPFFCLDKTQLVNL
jgi:hypothetical protein